MTRSSEWGVVEDSGGEGVTVNDRGEIGIGEGVEGRSGKL